MRIAICEDNHQDAKVLRATIDQWSRERNAIVSVCWFAHAEEFLMKWSDAPDFDLIFIDIRMGAINGMELSKVIRNTDEHIPLVFLTGMKDFISDGYSVSALHYLIKPVDSSVYTVLDRASRIAERRKSDSLVVDLPEKKARIRLDEIMYFEADGHHIIAHGTFGHIKFRGTIGVLETQLPRATFCRCHRGIIVHLASIRSILRESLSLNNNESKVLSVSKRYWPQLNQAFLEYYGKL